MNLLKNKIASFKKFFFETRPTRPCVMGNKILFLATAPCVKDFFEYESVREQFADCDIACINYMLVYSTKEIFEIKPKYIILFDPIFYDDSFFPGMTHNPEKEAVVNILEKIDWNCYLVTSTLADFGIKNGMIQYVRLSCFEVPYKKIWHPFYKHNWINMGIYNVMQGALYFAVTFGYKDIAILGCTYQIGKLHMEDDGLHIDGYRHYYNLERTHEVISMEVLNKSKESSVANIYARGYKSLMCFWNLKRYADSFGAKIVNYSEGSAIDAFECGKLDIH